MTEPASRPILELDGVRIAFDVDGERVVAVDEVGFGIARDEVVALVGESGSGKSVTAMSVLGLLPRNATVTGSIRLDGEELLTAAPAELRAIRGGRVAMVFQDPIAALNPVFTVGFQLVEAVRLHRPDLDRDGVRDRAIALLSMVELDEPELRMRQYPHQLSGGQAQRVVIAMALAGDPELLIADEPTTALDVTVQAEILEVLRRLRERLHSSVLLITHDMGVVADLADRVVVMRRGVVVETGEATELFESPTEPYTRELLAAVPRLGERVAPGAATDATTAGGADGRGAQVDPVPVLEIDDLVVEYRRGGRTIRAVDGVSLTVRPGEILALVGESGSGKSTTALAALGLAPVRDGAVRFDGIDVRELRGRTLQRIRRRVGVVFQNPATSLDPRFDVARAVAEPLRVHLRLRGRELDERVDELLEQVGLSGGWRERYPHELSGGQRQRVAIARAVALGPDLLIADEPTSALDVSVQARVLDVFRELQSRLGFACLFVSHDLAVVDSLCDRVAVMRAGRVVEQGPRERVLGDPADPYTRALIAAAPVPDPRAQRARRSARLAG